MTWGFLWLMLALKIPLAALIYIVWWAIEAEPEQRTPPTMAAAALGATRIVSIHASRSHTRVVYGDPAPARRPACAPFAPAHARSVTDRLSCRRMSDAPASVLSDGTIIEFVSAGRIVIEPWDPGLVQPASVDLRLGDSFRVFHNHRASAIDLRYPPENLTEEVVVPEGESFVIHPGEFCLGRTLEWVELPDDIVARIEGKSSGPARADRPRHRRLLRSGLEGDADAGAQQPDPGADQALPRARDRPALVHDARPAGPAPLRQPGAR